MTSRLPKLVATDLDGTLLHTDGTVTARTREVLDAVDAQGVTVVFVTGRPIRWMEPLWHHVGDHGLAICSNGGIVYDVPGRSVLEARPIPRHVGLKVADLVRMAIPGSVFALEKTTGTPRSSRAARTARVRSVTVPSVWSRVPSRSVATRRGLEARCAGTSTTEREPLGRAVPIAEPLG